MSKKDVAKKRIVRGLKVMWNKSKQGYIKFSNSNFVKGIQEQNKNSVVDNYSTDLTAFQYYEPKSKRKSKKVYNEFVTDFSKL